MILRRLLPLAFAAFAATTLSAQDMSEAERAEFRAEVRAYLLENPEVLMEAIAVLENRERDAQASADQALATAYATQLGDDGFSYVGGNPEGDVVLVEFMDYRCGYCRRAFAEVEELIAADSNIRFVLKEFPILGEQSVMASRFAIATQIVEGDEAYKDVHDALMTINADITLPTLTRLAEGLVLDTDAIMAEMDSAAVTERINATRELAQALQITGTPTLVMNDQMLRGYVPLAQMQQIAASLRLE
jgi:protein-disulfide isomerase